MKLSQSLIQGKDLLIRPALLHLYGVDTTQLIEKCLHVQQLGCLDKVDLSNGSSNCSINTVLGEEFGHADIFSNDSLLYSYQSYAW